MHIVETHINPSSTPGIQLRNFSLQASANLVLKHMLDNPKRENGLGFLTLLQILTLTIFQYQIIQTAYQGSYCRPIQHNPLPLSKDQWTMCTQDI